MATCVNYEVYIFFLLFFVEMLYKALILSGNCPGLYNAGQDASSGDPYISISGNKAVLKTYSGYFD